MKIFLNDTRGNSIEIEANDVKNYYGSNYPKKDCTLIIFNDGTEIRVFEDFETVNFLVMKSKETKQL